MRLMKNCEFKYNFVYKNTLQGTFLKGKLTNQKHVVDGQP